MKVRCRPLDGLEARDGLARRSEEAFAGGREADSFARPLEQFLADLLLELENCFGYRLHGDRFDSRGRGEGARFRCTAEELKLSNIHRHSFAVYATS